MDQLAFRHYPLYKRNWEHKVGKQQVDHQKTIRMMMILMEIWKTQTTWIPLMQSVLGGKILFLFRQFFCVSFLGFIFIIFIVFQRYLGNISRY